MLTQSLSVQLILRSKKTGLTWESVCVCVRVCVCACDATCLVFVGILILPDLLPFGADIIMMIDWQQWSDTKSTQYADNTLFIICMKSRV